MTKQLDAMTPIAYSRSKVTNQMIKDEVIRLGLDSNSQATFQIVCGLPTITVDGVTESCLLPIPPGPDSEVYCIKQIDLDDKKEDTPSDLSSVPLTADFVARHVFRVPLETFLDSMFEAANHQIILDDVMYKMNIAD